MISYCMVSLQCTNSTGTENPSSRTQDGYRSAWAELKCNSDLDEKDLRSVYTKTEIRLSNHAGGTRMRKTLEVFGP